MGMEPRKIQPRANPPPHHRAIIGFDFDMRKSEGGDNERLARTAAFSPRPDMLA